MLAGESIALVSDAGVPLISDPGDDLVNACIENGVEVVPLPGACALITALTVGGLPAARFSFEGFLSVNKKSRFAHLKEVKDDKRTLVFYEAPHKLVATLQDFLEYFGDRRIVLCRELTKKFEECIRTTISGALEYYQEKSPKGEYVLLVEGKQEETAENFWSTLTLEEHYAYYLENGFEKKEALKLVAKDRGLHKRDVYEVLFKKEEKSN